MSEEVDGWAEWDMALEEDLKNKEEEKVQKDRVKVCAKPIEKVKHMRMYG